jgi:hypothetical protein
MVEMMISRALINQVYTLRPRRGGIRHYDTRTHWNRKKLLGEHSYLPLCAIAHFLIRQHASQ